MVTNLQFNLFGVPPQTFQVNPSDRGLSRFIREYHFREPLNTYFLADTVARNGFDAVLDVGANIGYFALLELAAGAKHVVAVEPVHENFSYLKTNLSQFANVTLLNHAVSDYDGTVEMYLTERRNLCSCLPPRNQTVTGKADVPCFTLQTVINRLGLQGKRLLVRMDVEGYETRILKNLPSEVKAVCFELHSNYLGSDRCMKLLRSLMCEGFCLGVACWGGQTMHWLLRNIKHFHVAWRLFELVNRRRAVIKKPCLKQLYGWIRRGESYHLTLTRL